MAYEPFVASTKTTFIYIRDPWPPHSGGRPMRTAKDFPYTLLPHGCSTWIDFFNEVCDNVPRKKEGVNEMIMLSFFYLDSFGKMCRWSGPWGFVEGEAMKEWWNVRPMPDAFTAVKDALGCSVDVVNEELGWGWLEQVSKTIKE